MEKTTRKEKEDEEHEERRAQKCEEGDRIHINQSPGKCAMTSVGRCRTTGNGICAASCMLRWNNDLLGTGHAFAALFKRVGDAQFGVFVGVCVFALHDLCQVLPSTTLHDKVCRKYPPYYFALQRLHNVLPSTTLYYKTSAKYSPYYFVLIVLQHLHKVLPSTSLYYKTSAKYSPYYFVQQHLHKVLPSTTLYYKICILTNTTSYYKTCTKYFPVPDLPHKVVAEVSKIGNL